MELKKSYKGFVIWMAAFCAVCLGTVFLPIRNTNILLRIINNCCTLGVTLLSFIIYKTEYVYWYNGTSYEEAVNASSERRRAFAWKHFQSFGLFSIAFFAFSIIAQIMEINCWIDIVIVTAGIIAVAIRTIKFKL